MKEGERSWTEVSRGAFLRLCAQANPQEVLRLLLAQGRRCSPDTKVQNGASRFPFPQGQPEGRFSKSRNLIYPAGEARDQVFHSLYSARLKKFPLLFPNPVGGDSERAQSKEERGPEPSSAVKVPGHGPSSPGRPNSADPLCQPGAQRPGSPWPLQHGVCWPLTCGAASSPPPSTRFCPGYLLRDPG